MLRPYLIMAVLTPLLSFSTQAEPLSIYGASLPAPTLPGYGESINLAPPFHVWQNDPELKDFYIAQLPNNAGITDLCIPSSMANLLLYQLAKRSPPLPSLLVPGLTQGQPVDGANVVKGIIEKCAFHPKTIMDKKGRIEWLNAGSCLSQIYQRSGYPNAEITYIRPNQGTSSAIQYLDRYPVLSDIRTAFQNGSEVIAVISRQKYSEVDDKWLEVGFHSINLFGYSANDSLSDSLVVYLQNTNRLYRMDFKTPVFDVAMLTQNAEPSPVPDKSSAIELTTIQGRLLNFPGERTFLAGLILIHLK